jgi:hypothetical protein
MTDNRTFTRNRKRTQAAQQDRQAKQRERFFWMEQLAASDYTPFIKLVGLRIALHKNDDNGRCFAAYDKLAERVNSKPRSVKRAMAVLARDGWINIKKGGGSGRANEYQLIPRAEKGDSPVTVCAKKTVTREVKTVTQEVKNGDSRVTPIRINNLAPKGANIIESESRASRAHTIAGVAPDGAPSDKEESGLGREKQQRKIYSDPSPTICAGVKNKQTNWTDDEMLQNMRGLAHATRQVWQLGHVQIDSGDAPPTKPFRKPVKAQIGKIWSRLSEEDQRTLTKREAEVEAKWSAWQREHQGNGEGPDTSKKDYSGNLRRHDVNLAPNLGAATELSLRNDNFDALKTIWQRGWLDEQYEAQDRQAYAKACRETDLETIIEAAKTWVAAADAPRFLPPLHRWLNRKGWEKVPPSRRQRTNGRRNGGKTDLTAIAFKIAGHVQQPDGTWIHRDHREGLS